VGGGESASAAAVPTRRGSMAAEGGAKATPARLGRRLLSAIDAGNAPEALRLIDLGADTSVTDEDGDGALINAVLRSLDDVALRLIAVPGTDVNAVSREGATPLLCACAVSREAVALALIEAGGDVHATGPGGATPLGECGDMPAVRAALLARGAGAGGGGGSAHTAPAPAAPAPVSPPAPRAPSAPRPTSSAPRPAAVLVDEAGASKVLSAILGTKEAGPSRSDYGLALLEAIAQKRVDAALQLIDKADLATRDEHGSTALTLACIEELGAVALKLLDAGAPVNAASDDGTTPLMAASYRGLAAVAQRLLESGANFDARSDSGWTPLIYACANAREGIALQLIHAGANVNARLRNGTRTPLNSCAGSSRMGAVVAALRAKGAKEDIVVSEAPPPPAKQEDSCTIQ
jgi:ankyrin repeat protein